MSAAMMSGGRHNHLYGTDPDEADMQICMNRWGDCDARRRSILESVKPTKAQEHSETSKAAARKVSGTRSHALRVAARQAYLRAGANGLTDDEMLMALQQYDPDLRDNSTRPRRIELCEGGWLVKAGWTRKTRTGSPAEVYIPVEFTDQSSTKLSTDSGHLSTFDFDFSS